MSISENINRIKIELQGTPAQLIAVSKTKPMEMILEAYQTGQRAFGENKVQELVEKHELLPKDIQWHMIGHLQRNKVKYIASFVHLIHGVDTVQLLQEINKEGLKNNRVIPCLLQIYIAKEETKFGLDQHEVKALLQSPLMDEMKYIKIVGLMGMATNTDNESQIAAEFAGLNQFMKELQANYHHPSLLLTEISMGMSGDYALAIQNGSTLIRIGSTIFGDRNYHN